MADPLTFDFDSVTPRMLVDFEDKVGQSLTSFLSDKGTLDMLDMPSAALCGFVWLSLRMSGQPDATWDDALDTPFASLEFAEERPTPASTDAP